MACRDLTFIITVYLARFIKMDTSGDLSDLTSLNTSLQTSTPPPNSSFEEYPLEEDLSAYSHDFFRGLPGLQSPEHPDSNLVPPISNLVPPISNLVFPNPDNDEVPEEDANEVDADPGANDSDDFEEESFGDMRPRRQAHVDDEEEEEEDELQSSPVRPPERKTPLPANVIHSPYPLPPRAEEVQLGGGYKRREASPLPAHLQPTSRLRRDIKPSARSTAETAALHELRAESSKPVGAPAVAPAPAPAPAPARPNDPLPRLDLARMHTERLRATPPPQRSNTPPQRARTPLDGARAAALLRPVPAPLRAVSVPPSGPEPAPPTRPSSPPRPPSPTTRPPSPPPPRAPRQRSCPPTPDRSLLPPPPTHYNYWQKHDLPPPPEGYMGANAFDELERSLEQPFPPSSAPQPSDPAALFDDGVDVEMTAPQHNEDAASTVGDNDETRSTSVVERADTPLSLSAIDNEDVEMEDEEVETATATDGGMDVEGHGDEVSEGGGGGDGEVDGKSAIDPGGRPSKSSVGWRKAFIQDVQEMSKMYAQQSGIPAERFMKALGSHTAGGFNPWNTYQTFATDPENIVNEYRRIAPPGWRPAIDKIPTLGRPERLAMFNKFKGLWGDEKAKLILQTYDEKMFCEKGETLINRQRAFEKQCQEFTETLETFGDKKQDAIIFFVGSVVSEDMELGRIIATPGLNTSFAEAFKDPTTGRPYSASHLLGVAKTCAYNSRMKDNLSGGTVLDPGPAPPTPAFVPATGSGASAGASAASATASVTPATASSHAPTASTSTTVPNASASTSTITVKTEGTGGTRRKRKDGLRAEHMNWQDTTFYNIIDTFPVEKEDHAWLRTRWSAMSVAELGYDVFRKEKPAEFSWLPLHRILKKNGVRLVGYPNNLMFPGETEKGRTQATGSWRMTHMAYFNLALREYERNPAHGMRVEEHVPSATGDDFVIISHDYNSPPPPGPPEAVELYWNNCGGKRVRCVHQNGDFYTASIDLAHGGSPAVGAALFQKRATTSRKDAKEDEEGDEVVEVTQPTKRTKKAPTKAPTKAATKAPQPPTEAPTQPPAEASTSARPSRSTSRPRPKALTAEMKAEMKQKAKGKVVEVVDVDVESQDTEDDTPLTAKTPGKRKTVDDDTEYVEPTPRASKSKDTKRGRTPPAPPAPSPPSDYYFASDTDNAQPPVKRHKTRADGPVSAPPVVQQGGGRRAPPTAAAKAPEKHVSFADRPANDREKVAARRAAMANIPPPEGWPADEYPIGDSRRPPPKSTRSTRSRTRVGKPPVDPDEPEPVIPPYSYPSPPPNTRREGIMYSTDGTAVPIGTVFAQPQSGAHVLVDGLSPAPSAPIAPTPALPPAPAPSFLQGLAPTTGAPAAQTMVVDVASYQMMQAQLQSLMQLQESMQGRLERFAEQHGRQG
ncbi:hypothetical protein R3P38DRAFT_2758496 [Favolaschia claudopus]|uniref:Uncharacterized protein n=1 Tax=Favolaschia claudopus TaxID=2862362 RepID=A0AAW0EFK4_9AGAR